MPHPAATVITPEITAQIHEIVAYSTDDAGQTFATVILRNGDVIDTDALDIHLTKNTHPAAA